MRKANYIIVKLTDDQQSELFNDLQRLLDKKKKSGTGADLGQNKPKTPNQQHIKD
tara:strand:+ start:8268 stop:8432 length:165 start_codon:yes stop_codon:yes gene_type:complete